jgi:hypothetical protein
MTVEYTVYCNIQAYDESKVDTLEDDCWYPSQEVELATFATLADAETFMENLPRL